MKLGRTYALSVEVGPFAPASGAIAVSNATGHVDIYPPMTCSFEIRRNYLASAQTATFTVSQLSPKTRDIIFKDRFNTLQWAALQFRAGYISQGGFLPLIFNGTLRWAYSQRVNTNEFQTVMEGFDGGFAMANGYTSRSFAAGTELSDVIRAINSDLPNVYPTPIVGNIQSKAGRGMALFGPSFKLIQDNLPPGSAATIDNNQLKVLNDNEYLTFTGLNADAPVLSSSTGLLGVPVRSGAMIVCQILFEPRLTVGSAVFLKSEGNPLYNGLKKVMGFTHRGVISGGIAADGTNLSGSVNGDCVTEVQLWGGTQALVPVVGTNPQ